MLNRHFTPFPVLTTGRLTLRQLLTGDEQEIFTLRSDSEINKYLDRQPSKTLDDARDFINKVTENYHKNEALYWAIALHGSHKLVGTVCLFGFSDQDDRCEIGYELLTSFQGQGIMKEAAAKVMDYACNTMKVQRMEAFIHRDNRPSIKLVEQLSFRKSDEVNEADPELACFYLTDFNRQS